MGHVPSTTSRRQALFARASEKALKGLAAWQQENPNAKRPLIVLTGGLCSLDLMTAALHDGHADMLGIGRLSVISTVNQSGCLICPCLDRRIGPLIVH